MLSRGGLVGTQTVVSKPKTWEHTIVSGVGGSIASPTMDTGMARCITTISSDLRSTRHVLLHKATGGLLRLGEFHARRLVDQGIYTPQDPRPLA